MTRLYLVLGFGFVAIGFVGAFLPVLPTTPFVILAVACFARSSPRLERWLIRHRRFGPPLRAWRERGAIPVKAKALALAGVSLGLPSLWLVGELGPLPMAIAAAMALTGLAYVLTRPSA